MSKSAIQCTRLFDGEDWRLRQCVLLDGESIAAVVPADQRPQNYPLQAGVADTLAPGFIDLQVNGGGGSMFNNHPDRHTVDVITAAHRSLGTTALLPTLLSDTGEVQQQAADAVRRARSAGNRGVLGLHIEGPFFAPARRGAHMAEMIRSPEAADIEWLCGLDDLILLVTLAPEQAATGQIRRLSEAGVRVCAGHTNAGYEDMRAAQDEGLCGVTHLFNAMSPLTARQPNAVGAALDIDELWVGVIADGHHVHPASLRIACRAKPAGKVFLVSDAMATVAADTDSFEIYGEEITAREGRLVNADGVLAGSAIGLIDAVRVCTEQVGLPLAESLRMASLYPAQFIGMERKLGRIAEGYRADLVHFDTQFRVRDTWVAGVHAGHGER